MLLVTAIRQAFFSAWFALPGDNAYQQSQDPLNSKSVDDRDVEDSQSDGCNYNMHKHEMSVQQDLVAGKRQRLELCQKHHPLHEFTGSSPTDVTGTGVGVLNANKDDADDCSEASDESFWIEHVRETACALEHKPRTMICPRLPMSMNPGRQRPPRNLLVVLPCHNHKYLVHPVLSIISCSSTWTTTTTTRTS